jgi:hypothetical protein
MVLSDLNSQLMMLPCGPSVRSGAKVPVHVDRTVALEVLEFWQPESNPRHRMMTNMKQTLFTENLHTLNFEGEIMPEYF